MATIGKEIVQREHRGRGRITSRLVAQPVITARREPRDSRPARWLRHEGTALPDHGETGSPASGGESTAGP